MNGSHNQTHWRHRATRSGILEASHKVPGGFSVVKQYGHGISFSGDNYRIIGCPVFVGRAEQGIKFGQGINGRFGQRRTIMAQELLRPLQARFQPEF